MKVELVAAIKSIDEFCIRNPQPCLLLDDACEVFFALL